MIDIAADDMLAQLTSKWYGYKNFEEVVMKSCVLTLRGFS